MTIQDIASLLQIQKDSTKKILGFSADSRRLGKDFAFFALEGERVDGHDFLSKAKENGAELAIVRKSYSGEDFGLTLLPVESPLKALQDLARLTLEKHPAKVIAITGSIGKTTTKEFTYTLLEKRFRCYRSPGNFNSHYGLPLALLNREGNEEILILEMAMRKKGEIKELVSIAPPDIALITNVELVHAKHFEKGLSGIAEAKGEIFSHPKTKIRLLEDQLLSYGIFSNVTTFSYKNKKADLYLSKELFTKLPFSEEHFISDFAAAAAIAEEMGLGSKEIIERSTWLKTPSMRFERVVKKGIIFINDAYNASPTSMHFALKALGECTGRKIAVLGEMAELGSFSQKGHYNVGIDAAKFADLLLCSGKECEHMLHGFLPSKKPGEHLQDQESLIERLREIAKEGDTVLVKASRFANFDQIVTKF